ncbi:hypothetical protein JB92DRAFT_2830546 [Gautieria morchelliformis]|nr:hypothetical protein JB92DRAFT_2830546 [Gautieria morchelliformis]
MSKGNAVDTGFPFPRTPGGDIALHAGALPNATALVNLMKHNKHMCQRKIFLWHGDGYMWGRHQSDKVLRGESNFIWASHQLTLEMEPFWFWNASHDYHGTSMNRIALLHPATLKTFAKQAT